MYSSSQPASKARAFTRYMTASAGISSSMSSIMPSVCSLTQAFKSLQVSASNSRAKTSAPAKDAQSARKSRFGSNVPSSRNQTEFASFASVPSTLDMYAARDARMSSASRPKTCSICASVSPRAPASVMASAASTLTGETSTSPPS